MANYQRQTTMYCEEMRQLFKIIPVTVTEEKLYEYKQKIKVSLIDIGGEWYINKLR